MKEITLPANTDSIEAVTHFVNEQLEPMSCPERTRIQLSVAIDELFGNIANYAYVPEEGQATVRVETEDNPRGIIITFIDSGTPYNPLEAKEPDTTLPARQRRIGGLGIFMVKKTMDDITYEYKDGQNILTVRKNF